jgi:hypothetical protein
MQHRILTLFILIVVFFFGLFFNKDISKFGFGKYGAQVYSIFDTGLVARYMFDEGSGTVVTNSVVGNSGILIGGPIWSTAEKVIGASALNLDGINDTVTIDSIASSINKNEGTFSAWVYARSYTGGSPFQADGIIEVGSSASSNDGISLSPSSAANVSMNYRTGGVTTRATITNAPIRKWYHVAGTWNSSTLSIYLNGALYNSVANGTLTSATLNQARIGSDSLGTANQDYFDGYIDDVRIYSRALSASEIADLYNSDIGATVTLTPIAGSCSSVRDQCLTGTFSDLPDSNTHYLWMCEGQNGGGNTSCSFLILS